VSVSQSEEYNVSVAGSYIQFNSVSNGLGTMIGDLAMTSIYCFALTANLALDWSNYCRHFRELMHCLTADIGCVVCIGLVCIRVLQYVERRNVYVAHVFAQLYSSGIVLLAAIGRC
jgi:hypothetical protein